MHRPFAKREPAAADKLVTWRPTKLKRESRAYPPKWDECWLSIGMGWRNRAPHHDRRRDGMGTGGYLRSGPSSTVL
jgi:hypothetical protein